MLMQSAIDGFNVCIFAYGQTGSGKTFTIQGQDNQLGLVPRGLEELYRIRQKLGAQFEVVFETYMVELYLD